MCLPECLVGLILRALHLVTSVQVLEDALVVVANRKRWGTRSIW